MAEIAKRLLIDVIFAWVFAVLWQPVIRWAILGLILFFAWNVWQAGHDDLKQHGAGHTVDLSQIALNYDVDGHVLNWSVTNNTGEKIGKIVISCEDGEFSDYVAPDQYVAAGETLTGSNDDSDFSYASVCKITNAYSFSK